MEMIRLKKGGVSCGAQPPGNRNGVLKMFPIGNLPAALHISNRLRSVALEVAAAHYSTAKMDE